MLSHWSAAALAKTKVTALIATSLAAGGVGGAVALSHMAPTTHVITRSAASTSVDPETADSQDPETVDATTGEPQTDESQPDESQPDETQPDESGSGESGSGGPADYTLPPCPSDVRNHGDYVSSVAKSAPKGKGARHGHWVSQAAHSDCGKAGTDAGAGDPESGDASTGGSHPPKAGKVHHGKAPHHVVPEPDGSGPDDSAAVAPTSGAGHRGGHAAGHGPSGH